MSSALQIHQNRFHPKWKPRGKLGDIKKTGIRTVTGPSTPLCTHLPEQTCVSVPHLIFPLPIQIVRRNIQGPCQVVGVFHFVNQLKVSWRPQLYWKERRIRADTSALSVCNRAPPPTPLQQGWCLGCAHRLQPATTRDC